MSEFKFARISDYAFNKILLALKDNVYKDACRPQLQYIKLEFFKDRLIGWAIDGYTLGRIYIPCSRPDGDEFVAYIKPFNFKYSTTSHPTDVDITLKDNIVEVSYSTSDGSVTYTFKQPKPWDDYTNLYNESKSHSVYTNVNARYMMKACKALAAAGSDKRNFVCTIETDDASTLKTLCISAKADMGIQIDQAICPIRLGRGD